VTLVYCGQPISWLKMEFGMQIGFGPGHIVLYGDPIPPLSNGHRPYHFLAHIC